MFTVKKKECFQPSFKCHAALSALLIICSVMPLTLSAQMPEIVRDTIYATDTYDFASHVIRIENGYAVIGAEDQHELNTAYSGDYFVNTYDENGIELSHWTYGGFNNEEGLELIQTADGGYILIGHSLSNGGDVSNHHQSPNGVRPDAWVVKIDSGGEIEWERSLGGSGSDGGYDIEILSDSTYLVAGKAATADGDVSSSWGGDDAWVVHLDQSGEILWEKNYGGSGNELIWDMQLTDDGFIFIGNASSSNGDLISNPIQSYSDAWLVKCNTIGEIEWQHTFGNPTYSDYGRTITKTADGYLASFVRYLGPGTGASTINVVKLDFDGQLTWTYESEANANYAMPSGLTFSENGDILILGTVSSGGVSHIMLMQISNETGDHIWTYDVPEMVSPIVTSSSVAYGITSLHNDEFVIVGHTYHSDTDEPQMDARIIKFALTGVAASLSDIEQQDYLLFPNPSQNVLNFSSDIGRNWNIIDMTGRIVQSGSAVREGLQSVNIGSLPGGAYLLSLSQNSGISKHRFVKE